MNTSMITYVSKIARVGLFSVVLAAALGGLARADELPDFTGYTRPGVPNGKAATQEGHIVFVSDEAGVKTALLGGTVYFTVIDMAGRDEDDVWVKAAHTMVESFVPGKDSNGMSSPEFDTTARYLYLYQVVNDMPQTQSAIRRSSVFLIDPTLLTSWGFFPGRAFAFAEEKAGKVTIQPVSYTDAVEGNRRIYRHPDGAHLVDDNFRIGAYASRGPGEVRPAAEGDPVRNLDTLVLRWGEECACATPLVWGGLGEVDGRGAREREAAYRYRSALEANWLDKNLLRPRERSALFGFTSNFPPVYDDVRLRGLKVFEAGGIKPVAYEGGATPVAAGTSPVGQVPVPVPPAEFPAVGGFGGAGLLGGTLPGFGGVGGGLGGGAFLGSPGFLAPPGFGGSGAGAGTGGGNGSNTGAQSQNGTQNQAQAQPQNVTVTNTIGPIVQQQSQQQQQQQQQQQSSSSGSTPVVPGPSSVILALLGAPILFWLRWRRG